MLLIVRLIFALLLTAASVAVLHFLDNSPNAGIDPLTTGVMLVAFIIAVFVSPRLYGIGEALDARREKGQVKWFNVSKGYGFITRESGGDVFVHFRGIRGRGRRNLKEGQSVSFVMTEGEKGPQADDVVIEGDGSSA